MSTLQKICETFDKIKAVSSRLKKDEILRKLISKPKAKDQLREMLVYTFHPYFNYWVTSDDEFQICAKGRNGWREFKRVLDKLRNREITGNAARKLAFEQIFNTYPDAAPWFCRILDRDLKIGMQLKSFEKHFGELVPKFSPMLASSWDEKEIKEEVAIEPKLDGLRCFAIFPVKGEATTVSRNGRPIYNTEKILSELSYLKGWVLDGEIVGSSWGEGVSFAHTKTKNKSSGKFVVFDAITFDEWNQKKCKRNYIERRKRLLGLIPKRFSRVEVLRRLVRIQKYSAKEIKRLAKKHMEWGFEGILVKTCSGTYDFKRSNNWLKLKYKATDEFRVVGRKEGKGKGRNKGLLGALIVKGKVNGTKIKSEVGQGFSDKDRKYFWRLPKDELTSLVIEVEHYGITKDLRMRESDKLPALRNGIFLKIREDKMER